MPLTPARRHAWDLSPAAARDLQLKLAGQVELADRFGDIRLVAGIDIGLEQAGKLTRAAIAVLRLPDLAASEQQVARQRTSFPYIPGLLSFRAIPAALAALAATPDLLLCDRQGFAHPWRFGLARRAHDRGRQVAPDRHLREPGPERAPWRRCVIGAR